MNPWHVHKRRSIYIGIWEGGDDVCAVGRGVVCDPW